MKIIISFHCFWKSPCNPSTLHQGRPDKTMKIATKNSRKPVSFARCRWMHDCCERTSQLHLYHIKLQKHIITINFRLSRVQLNKRKSIFFHCLNDLMQYKNRKAWVYLFIIGTIYIRE